MLLPMAGPPRSSWHREPGRPLPEPQLSGSSRPTRAATAWITGRVESHL